MRITFDTNCGHPLLDANLCKSEPCFVINVFVLPIISQNILVSQPIWGRILRPQLKYSGVSYMRSHITNPNQNTHSHIVAKERTYRAGNCPDLTPSSQSPLRKEGGSWS